MNIFKNLQYIFEIMYRHACSYKTYVLHMLVFTIKLLLHSVQQMNFCGVCLNNQTHILINKLTNSCNFKDLTIK